jgi:hypothetical protein
MTQDERWLANYHKETWVHFREMMAKGNYRFIATDGSR